MEFIDNLGHVFSLKTYDDDPVAIKYDEQEYVFWIKEDQISINNYYILPIKFLMSYEFLKEMSDIYEEGVNEGFSLTIESDSNFYRLISPKTIQEKIEADNVQTLNDSIFFKADKDFTNKLDLSDFYFDIQNIDNSLIVYNEDKKYVMFPFYVVGYSKFEGTFLSNIMIKCNYSTNVQDVNPDNTPKTKTITVTKEEYYDDLLKQTFDEIRIYEWEKNDRRKGKLVTTILPNYTENDDEVEIITAHSNNRNIEYDGNTYSRIRNFPRGVLPNDTFHVIFKLKPDEYLDVNKCYCIEGLFYKRCAHCRTVIDYNHDGSNDNSTPILPNQPDEWYGYDDSGYICGRTEAFPGKTIARGLDDSFITGPEYIDENGNYILKAIIGFTREEGRIFIPNGYSYGGLFKSDVRDISLDIDNSIEVLEEGRDIERPVFKLATEYTPITVGGTFVDECEELIINGQNMGFRFPKDIVKAFYQSSIYNKTVDEKLLKDKMKELLLNYMGIRGECGNFNSMLKSLYWFGWGDKIEISKLLKTDNDFQDQYILDYFTIDNDLKYTYRFFNESNMVSLSLKENAETGIYNLQNWNADFVGEGNPDLENLFDKVEEVQHEQRQGRGAERHGRTRMADVDRASADGLGNLRGVGP